MLAGDTYSANHHDRCHLQGGRDDGLYKGHENKGRLARSPHPKDPRETKVNLVHIESICEGGKDILQSIKEPPELGRGETSKELRSYFVTNYATKVFQNAHAFQYLFAHL